VLVDENTSDLPCNSSEFSGAAGDVFMSVERRLDISELGSTRDAINVGRSSSVHALYTLPHYRSLVYT